jgi:hypothetical protein
MSSNSAGRVAGIARYTIRSASDQAYHRGAMFVAARAFRLAIIFSIASVWRPALAQSPQRGVQAVYVGGPNCPAEAEFWAQVDAHRQNPSNMGSLAVRVEVFELEGRAQARVMFGAAPAVTATRELSASSCREVAAAAALVVALALDADLDERKSPALPPARSADPPPPAPAPPPRFPDPAPARPREGSGLFWQLGGGALAQQAIAPSPMIGATAFAGLGQRELPWDARLSFVYAGSGVTHNNDASAEFSLLAGRIEGCAFAIVESERFFVDPCLALELGRVTSNGVENLRYSSEQQSSFWAAGGPLVRARYAFSELWLELFGGPWIPIAGTRDFVFEDPPENRSFHRVPPLGWAGGVRAALHLD